MLRRCGHRQEVRLEKLVEDLCQEAAGDVVTFRPSVGWFEDEPASPDHSDYWSKQAGRAGAGQLDEIEASSLGKPGDGWLLVVLGPDTAKEVVRLVLASARKQETQCCRTKMLHWPLGPVSTDESIGCWQNFHCRPTPGSWRSGSSRRSNGSPKKRRKSGSSSRCASVASALLMPTPPLAL